MADRIDNERKQDKSIDNDIDLGSLDDINLDFPGEGDEGVEASNGRSPTSAKKEFAIEAVKGFGGGVAQGAKVALFRAVPNAEPVVTEVKDTIDDIKALREDLSKQLQPIVRSVENASRRFLPKVQGIVPKKIYQKISDKLEKRIAEREPSGPTASKAQLEQQQIRAELESVFNANMEMNIANQAEAKKDQMVDRALGSSRHKQSLAQLTHVYDATRAIELFHKTQNMAYMKKSLELKYKHLFIARDTFNLLQQSMKTFEGYYKGILKNTALPDMMKQHMTDYIKKSRTEKYGEMMANVMGNIRGKIFERIKSGLTGAIDLIGMGAQGAEMAGEFDEMSDFGGKPKSQVPKWAGKLAGALSGFGLTSKFLKPGGGIARALSGGITGMRMRALDKYSQVQQKMANSDSLLGMMIADLMPNPFTKQDTASNDLVTKAKDAAVFDVITRQSIVEIIPGYLGKIWHEIEMIRTGRDDVEEKTYNVFDRRFTTKKEVKESLIQKAFGTEKDRRLSFSRTLGVLQGGLAANKPSMDAHNRFDKYKEDLHRVLINHGLYRKAFRPEQILDFVMGGQMNQYIKEITDQVKGDPREVLQAIVDALYVGDNKNKKLDFATYTKFNTLISELYHKSDAYRTVMAEAREVYSYNDGILHSDKLSSKNEREMQKFVDTPISSKLAREAAGNDPVKKYKAQKEIDRINAKKAEYQKQLKEGGSLITSDVNGSRMNLRAMGDISGIDYDQVNVDRDASFSRRSAFEDSRNFREQALKAAALGDKLKVDAVARGAIRAKGAMKKFFGRIMPGEDSMFAIDYDLGAQEVDEETAAKLAKLQSTRDMMGLADVDTSKSYDDIFGKYEDTGITADTMTDAEATKKAKKTTAEKIHEKIDKKLSGTAEKIVSGAPGVAESIGETLSSAWDTTKRKYKRFDRTAKKKGFKAAAGDLADSITKDLGKQGKKLKRKFKGLKKDVEGSDLYKAAKKKYKKAVKTSAKVMKAFNESYFGQQLTGGLTWVKDYIADLGDDVIEQLKEEGALDSFENFINYMNEHSEEFKQSFSDMPPPSDVDAWKRKFSSMKKTVTDVSKEGATAVGKTAVDVAGVIGKKFTEAKKKAENEEPEEEGTTLDVSMPGGGTEGSGPKKDFTKRVSDAVDTAKKTATDAYHTAYNFLAGLFGKAPEGQTPPPGGTPGGIPPPETPASTLSGEDKTEEHTEASGSLLQQILDQIIGLREDNTDENMRIVKALAAVDGSVHQTKDFQGDKMGAYATVWKDLTDKGKKIAKGAWNITKKVGKAYTEIYKGALGALGNAVHGITDLGKDVIGKVSKGVKAVGGWLTHREDYVDIYVKGKEGGMPIVSARKQRDADEGIFYKSSGKRVEHSRDIDEPCVDKAGNLVITEEDLKAGLVMNNGTPIGKLGAGLLSLGKSYLGIYTKGIEAIGGALKSAVGFMLAPNVAQYYDVYRKDELDKGPLVTGKKQREDGVFFVASGKRVKSSGDIVEPIMDKDKQILVTKEDLEHGLVDVNNKPLGSYKSVVQGILGGLQGIGGIATKGIKAGIGLYADFYKKLLSGGMDILGGALKGAGRFLGRGLGLDLGKGGMGGVAEFDKETKDSIVGTFSTLKLMQADLALIAEPYKKKDVLDKDGDGDIDGSYADQMEKKGEGGGGGPDAKDLHVDTDWSKDDDKEGGGGGEGGKDGGGSMFDMLGSLVPKKFRRRVKALGKLFGKKALGWAKTAGGLALSGLGSIGKGSLNLLGHIPGVKGLATKFYENSGRWGTAGGKALWDFANRYASTDALSKFTALGKNAKASDVMKLLASGVGGAAKTGLGHVGGLLKTGMGSAGHLLGKVPGGIGHGLSNLGGLLTKIPGVGALATKAGGLLGGLGHAAGGLLGSAGSTLGGLFGGGGLAGLGSTLAAVAGPAALAALAGYGIYRGVKGFSKENTMENLGIGKETQITGEDRMYSALGLNSKIGAKTIRGASKLLGLDALIKGIRGNDNPMDDKEIEQGRKKLQHRINKGMPGYDRILQEYEKAVEAGNWARARQLSGKEAEGFISRFWKESIFTKSAYLGAKYLFGAGEDDKEMTQEEINKVHAKYDSIIKKGGASAKNAQRLKDRFDDYVAEGDWKRARQIAGKDFQGKGGLFGKIGSSIVDFFVADKDKAMTQEEVDKHRKRLQDLAAKGNKAADKVLQKFEEAVTEMNWKRARQLVGDETMSGIMKLGGAVGSFLKWTNPIGWLYAALETDQDKPMTEKEIQDFNDKMQYLITKKHDKRAERRLDMFNEAVANNNWAKARKIANTPHKSAAARAWNATYNFLIGSEDEPMKDEEMQKFRDSMNRKIQLGGGIGKMAQRKLDAFEDAVGTQNWKKARKLAESPNDGLFVKAGKSVAKAWKSTIAFFAGGNGTPMSDAEIEEARKRMGWAISEGKKGAQKRLDLFDDYVADEKWNKARQLAKMPYENVVKRTTKAVSNFLFGDENEALTPEEIDRFQKMMEQKILDTENPKIKGRLQQQLKAFNDAIAVENWPKARKISEIKAEGAVDKVAHALNPFNWFKEDYEDCMKLREKIDEKITDMEMNGNSPAAALLNKALTDFDVMVNRTQYKEAVEYGEQMLDMTPHEFAKAKGISSEELDKQASRAQELIDLIQKERDKFNGFFHPIKAGQLRSLINEIKQGAAEWGDEEFFEQREDELAQILQRPELMSKTSKSDINSDVFKRGEELLATIQAQRDKRNRLTSPIVVSRLNSLKDDVSEGVHDWSEETINEWYDRLSEIDDEYTEGRKGQSKESKKIEDDGKKLIEAANESLERAKKNDKSWIGSNDQVKGIKRLIEEIETSKSSWCPEQFDEWENQLRELDTEYKSKREVERDQSLAEKVEADIAEEADEGMIREGSEADTKIQELLKTPGASAISVDAYGKDMILQKPWLALVPPDKVFDPDAEEEAHQKWRANAKEAFKTAEDEYRYRGMGEDGKDRETLVRTEFERGRGGEPDKHHQRIGNHMEGWEWDAEDKDHVTKWDTGRSERVAIEDLEDDELMDIANQIDTMAPELRGTKNDTSNEIQNRCRAELQKRGIDFHAKDDNETRWTGVEDVGGEAKKAQNVSTATQRTLMGEKLGVKAHQMLGNKIDGWEWDAKEGNKLIRWKNCLPTETTWEELSDEDLLSLAQQKATYDDQKKIDSSELKDYINQIQSKAITELKKRGHDESEWTTLLDDHQKEMEEKPYLRGTMRDINNRLTETPQLRLKTEITQFVTDIDAAIKKCDDALFPPWGRKRKLQELKAEVEQAIANDISLITEDDLAGWTCRLLDLDSNILAERNAERETMMKAEEEARERLHSQQEFMAEAYKVLKAAEESHDRWGFRPIAKWKIGSLIEEIKTAMDSGELTKEAIDGWKERLKALDESYEITETLSSTEKKAGVEDVSTTDYSTDIQKLIADIDKAIEDTPGIRFSKKNKLKALRQEVVDLSIDKSVTKEMIDEWKARLADLHSDYKVTETKDNKTIEEELKEFRRYEDEAKAVYESTDKAYQKVNGFFHPRTSSRLKELKEEIHAAIEDKNLSEGEIDKWKVRLQELDSSYVAVKTEAKKLPEDEKPEEKKAEDYDTTETVKAEYDTEEQFGWVSKRTKESKLSTSMKQHYQNVKEFQRALAAGIAQPCMVGGKIIVDSIDEAQAQLIEAGISINGRDAYPPYVLEIYDNYRKENPKSDKEEQDDTDDMLMNAQEEGWGATPKPETRTIKRLSYTEEMRKKMDEEQKNRLDEYDARFLKVWDRIFLAPANMITWRRCHGMFNDLRKRDPKVAEDFATKFFEIYDNDWIVRIEKYDELLAHYRDHLRELEHVEPEEEAKKKEEEAKKNEEQTKSGPAPSYIAEMERYGYMPKSEESKTPTESKSLTETASADVGTKPAPEQKKSHLQMSQVEFDALPPEEKLKTLEQLQKKRDTEGLTDEEKEWIADNLFVNGETDTDDWDNWDMARSAIELEPKTKSAPSDNAKAPSKPKAPKGKAATAAKPKAASSPEPAPTSESSPTLTEQAKQDLATSTSEETPAPTSEATEATTPVPETPTKKKKKKRSARAQARAQLSSDLAMDIGEFDAKPASERMEIFERTEQAYRDGRLSEKDKQNAIKQFFVNGDDDINDPDAWENARGALSIEVSEEESVNHQRAKASIAKRFGFGGFLSKLGRGLKKAYVDYNPVYQAGKWAYDKLSDNPLSRAASEGVQSLMDRFITKPEATEDAAGDKVLMGEDGPEAVIPVTAEPGNLLTRIGGKLKGILSGNKLLGAISDKIRGDTPKSLLPDDPESEPLINTMASQLADIVKPAASKMFNLPDFLANIGSDIQSKFPKASEIIKDAEEATESTSWFDTLKNNSIFGLAGKGIDFLKSKIPGTSDQGDIIAPKVAEAEVIEPDGASTSVGENMPVEPTSVKFDEAAQLLKTQTDSASKLAELVKINQEMMKILAAALSDKGIKVQGLDLLTEVCAQTGMSVANVSTGGTQVIQLSPTEEKGIDLRKKQM